ncbi:DUF4192 family protein [Leucobacter insecticola]|uniref:DUF4192 family protein n=1 Tax=Leucobacter insecticola TaxID=2714934 RepID=A0A6G8FM07_9MICO|nr:DUF4192 family protein [Leucobacter insecticola]QIM17122.1 DUF4192 family protein [Leucobacter insecticola]
MHTDNSFQVLRCDTTADFLAALPQLTGFTAENSLFVVFFSGAHSGDAVRIDLPESDAPRAAASLLDFIVEVMRDMGADHAGCEPAIAITSSETFREHGGPPRLRLAKRIERRVRMERMGLRELCVLAADGWASYLDPSTPPGGRPLSDIEESALALAADTDWLDVPELSALGKIPEADPARADLVRAALEELPPYPTHLPSTNADSSHSPDDDDHEIPPWFEETAEIVRALANAAALSPEMTARLIRSAAHPDRWLLLSFGILIRPDFPSELACAMSAAPFTGVDIDCCADTEIDGGGESELQEHARFNIRGVLAGLSPGFTDHHRLLPVRDQLLRALSETPEPERPALSALSSWVWWLLGNQTVAQRQAEEALSLAPGHPLATMIEKLVSIPVRAYLQEQDQRRAA